MGDEEKPESVRHPLEPSAAKGIFIWPSRPCPKHWTGGHVLVDNFPMTNGGSATPVADLVDQLLATPKSLGGRPSWADGSWDGQKRIAWPVLVDGETVGATLVAITNTAIDELNFSISLAVQDRSVCRLDYDPPLKLHTNPIEPGKPNSGLVMRGPHYHGWADNRCLATPAALPKALDWRSELPNNLRTWENAFRWFLGENNIEQLASLPALPPRSRLI